MGQGSKSPDDSEHDGANENILHAHKERPVRSFWNIIIATNTLMLLLALTLLLFNNPNSILSNIEKLLEKIAEKETNSPVATILTLNDVYRINGIKRGTEGGMARFAHKLKQLRSENRDVLVLHGGDFLSPSLLGKEYKGAQMVDIMNHLDGIDDPEAIDGRLIVTFGNHEFDDSSCNKPDHLAEQVDKSQFIWLAGNLDLSKCGFAEIADSRNVLPYKTVTLAGIKFGIFGLTINNKDYWQTLKYRDASYDEDGMNKAIKEQLNLASYIKAAEVLSAKLRVDHDYVIALTHLDWAHDTKILSELKAAGPDLIIGGHNHAQGIRPEAGPRRAYKETAEALTVGIHTFYEDKDGAVIPNEQTSMKLDESVPVDASVQKLIDTWLVKHEQKFCSDNNLTKNCLSDKMGTTVIEWELDEEVNRSQETAIGNWLTEEMVQVAKANMPSLDNCSQGTTPIVGLLGSGSVRLNYNLPANYQMERRDIEEMFPFSMEIAAVCTTWGNLNAQVQHGLSKADEGGWPHLAELELSYIPASTSSDAKLKSMQLLNGSTPSDSDSIILVTNLYVAGQGDDYNWDICQNLPPKTKCRDAIKNDSETNAKLVGSYDLKEVILDKFSATPTAPVGPDKFESRHTREEP